MRCGQTMHTKSVFTLEMLTDERFCVLEIQCALTLKRGVELKMNRGLGCMLAMESPSAKKTTFTLGVHVFK